ncbi:uncharacterized protein LOC129590442 isoform X2 [Paramacrobiotus metropolitanus]|nr:uncharacterized protein LOC129590442 isoform X2 [Paramacrobiotus metropolitanus]XP_055341649.1 uncharacterized protein LOC129590442 isoform X2 [Paramacrobiotus metropolitanus]XP_055341650.1 uncharacterized protein LOC129590442 isoform X2 [Paramacrobiotus metropolitanus]
MQDVRVRHYKPASFQCAIDSQLLLNGSAKLFVLLKWTSIPFGLHLEIQPSTQRVKWRAANGDFTVNRTELEGGFTLYNFTIAKVYEKMNWAECAVLMVQSGKVLAQRSYIGTYRDDDAPFDYFRANMPTVVAMPEGSAIFICRISHQGNFSDTDPITFWTSWRHNYKLVYGDTIRVDGSSRTSGSLHRYLATYDRAQHQLTLNIHDISYGDEGPVTCCARHENASLYLNMEDFFRYSMWSLQWNCVTALLAVSATPSTINPWYAQVDQQQNCRIINGYSWMFTPNKQHRHLDATDYF